ncbi:Uncharacterised protein [Mycobacterium tuberculosis]|nr:Uncharacterised protein [Mycobacterium tuberculosis]
MRQYFLCHWTLDRFLEVMLETQNDVIVTIPVTLFGQSENTLHLQLFFFIASKMIEIVSGRLFNLLYVRKICRAYMLMQHSHLLNTTLLLEYSAFAISSRLLM